MATAVEPIREAAVAGMFYPGEAKKLACEVDAMLDAAPDVDMNGEVVGLVCPHAGYAYSGPTAAVGYRQVRGEAYDAVIVMGPSHRESFDGASVFVHGSYETPLGAAPVAADLAGAIVSYGEDATADWAGHRVLSSAFSLGPRGEHALEVQVPFLQRTVKDLRLVPIVVGHYDAAMCTRIGDAIADGIGDRRVLVVVSSDLYHGESESACNESDNRTLAAVAAMDRDELAQGLANRSLQACGGGPLLIALRVAERLGAQQGRLLAHTHSNAVTGREGSYVVGYGTVAFVRI